MATATPFIYKGSYGFRITTTFTEGLLDSATNIQLRIKPESGATLVKNLTSSNILVESNTAFYDVEEDDFATVGTYQLQWIDTTPGRFIPSDIKKLKVKDVI